MEIYIELRSYLEDVARGVDVHAAGEVVAEHVMVHPPREGLGPRRAADRGLSWWRVGP